MHTLPLSFSSSLPPLAAYRLPTTVSRCLVSDIRHVFCNRCGLAFASVPRAYAFVSVTSPSAIHRFIYLNQRCLHLFGEVSAVILMAKASSSTPISRSRDYAEQIVLAVCTPAVRPNVSSRVRADATRTFLVPKMRFCGVHENTVGGIKQHPGCKVNVSHNDHRMIESMSEYRKLRLSGTCEKPWVQTKNAQELMKPYPESYVARLSQDWARWAENSRT